MGAPCREVIGFHLHFGNWLPVVTGASQGVHTKIRAGSSLIVGAHGQLVGAVQALDNVSDDDIVELHVPTGTSLVYELDDDLAARSHYYLGDEEAIVAVMRAVANQGKMAPVSCRARRTTWISSSTRIRDARRAAAEHHGGNNMRRALNAALAVMIAGTVVAGAAVAQVQERTLRVGISLNEEHPQGQSVKRFGELLERNSNGKIRVKLFAAGSLGNDTTMISALRGGTQEMTVPDSSTLVRLVKEFGVLNFPMAINNEQEADALLDGPFGQMLLAKLPDKGLIGLAFWENGFRQVTNSRRPIKGPQDIAGLKLRVIQNPMFIDTFSALSANALPLPFPEVYTALEQKIVDGQENLTTTILSKFYEVQKHLALTRHIYNVWVLLLSKKTWDSMSAEEQRIVQEAAKEATAFERTTIREYGAKALDELKAKGMQVTELSSGPAGRDAGQAGACRREFSFVFGKETSKEMLDELQKMRRKK